MKRTRNVINRIYSIYSNYKETLGKLETLIEEYERQQLEEQQVCCDENTPYVPNIDDSNNQQVVSSLSTRDSLEVIGKNQQQRQQKIADGQQQDCLHKGENRHRKKLKD